MENSFNFLIINLKFFAFDSFILSYIYIMVKHKIDIKKKILSWEKEFY